MPCRLVLALLLGGCFAALDENLLLGGTHPADADGGEPFDMNDGCIRFSQDDVGNKISQVPGWSVVLGDDGWSIGPIGGNQFALTRPDTQSNDWMVIYDIANGASLVNYTVRAQIRFRDHNGVGNGGTRDCLVGHYQDNLHYYAVCFNYNDYFRIYRAADSQLEVLTPQYANTEIHDVALKFAGGQVSASVDGNMLVEAGSGKTSIAGDLANTGAVGFRADRATSFIGFCITPN